MTTGTMPTKSGKLSGPQQASDQVVVFCPDARPPSYELVRGLAAAGQLHGFFTGYYHKPSAFNRLLPRLGRHGRSLTGQLSRRVVAGLRPELVQPRPMYDMAIRLENRLAARHPAARARLARLRTDGFDKAAARRCPRLAREGAGVAVFFSDVGSAHAMQAARQAGMKVVLSMVTGHMDEEMEILAREQARQPRFFPVYLGDGALDLDELAWLHARRRRDLALADLVLVPSEHIARQVVDRSGVPASRVRVIPYAADPDRFTPQFKPAEASSERCRFLFAGGITQRKGLSDLLTAWQAVRRPGWELSLVGEAPKAAQNLIPADDPTIRLLGRVAYGQMPALMAEHDLFVFPSLFEGSAVVCYEALAAGLPVVTTPQAGSVVRHGVEGLIVPAAAPEELAKAMIRLGSSPFLRRQFAEAARLRALEHTWDHYRTRVMTALVDVVRFPFRNTADGPEYC